MLNVFLTLQKIFFSTKYFCQRSFQLFLQQMTLYKAF